MTQVSADLVLDERRDGVLTLTLNRPDQFNALSEEMLQALQARFDACMDDPGLRVVVLAANGRAFCAGHDLKQMRGHAGDRDYYRDLFGSCDLAVAAESARLAVSGINVGLFCATPSVALTRNVPLKNAFEMLVTGQFISARQAAERGLVNHAVPDADLDRAVQGLVDAILSKSPVAVRTGKAMVYRQLGLPLDQAYDYAAGIMAENMLAEDVGEGIDAFMQKRPPQWRGR